AFEYISPYIIESVTIDPNNSYAKVGDSVTITVTEAQRIGGLTSTPAIINGKQISLVDQGDGTYVGIYTVAEGDNDSTNVEARNIRLLGVNGVSSLAYSSDSELNIDAHTPSISSVTLTPDSGWLKTGDSVFITVTAENNETGLIPSNAIINEKPISLSDQGNGTYTGVYIVQTTDAQGVNLLAANIYLADVAGNVTGYTSSPRSSLKVDTYAPTISSATINPNAGTISVGDSVAITVTAGDNESGLIVSDARINGKFVSLTSQGDGTYTGKYFVEASDEEGINIEASGIILTDAAGNVSEPSSSTGSTLRVEIPQVLVIASVTISPNSGYLKIGDQVNITVTAKDNVTGLTPSDASINGKA
ncbi:unnamed protein product, partial [marine sediment metagenome]